ncbi:hypothetical protein QBC39DRAFT_148844 [Podospora conica]|nr:hypothetical protein QBC39DRAFT_148844 [Schizothecium conicum]
MGLLIMVANGYLYCFVLFLQVMLLLSQSLSWFGALCCLQFRCLDRFRRKDGERDLETTLFLLSYGFFSFIQHLHILTLIDSCDYPEVVFSSSIPFFRFHRYRDVCYRPSTSTSVHLHAFFQRKASRLLGPCINSSPGLFISEIPIGKLDLSLRMGRLQSRV